VAVTTISERVRSDESREEELASSWAKAVSGERRRREERAKREERRREERK
jgi:hypothetical protein